MVNGSCSSCPAECLICEVYSDELRCTECAAGYIDTEPSNYVTCEPVPYCHELCGTCSMSYVSYGCITCKGDYRRVNSDSLSSRCEEDTFSGGEITGIVFGAIGLFVVVVLLITYSVIRGRKEWL